MYAKVAYMSTAERRAVNSGRVWARSSHCRCRADTGGVPVAVARVIQLPRGIPRVESLLPKCDQNFSKKP